MDDNNISINQITDISIAKIKKRNITQKSDKNDPDILIKISSEGVRLSEYTNIVKNSEGSRTEKIQNLKNLINKGSYKINSEKIADKLIKDTLHGIINDD